jgi:cytidylate kinase
MLKGTDMTLVGFTVAIDGPAAAGKGTISRAIAARFDFEHLDTGLLYRAVGAKVAQGADPIEAAETLSAADLARDDLRSATAGRAASQIATIPEVRVALLAYQRSFARRMGGAVLDGRDIGTVICPDAEVKLFVTASDEVRAYRRWLELVSNGENLGEIEVLADLRARDRRDSERATSPLKPAEDALLLDTTELTIDAAVEKAVCVINERIRLGRAE